MLLNVYLASWACINLSSVAADIILRKTKISRTSARRFFSLLGLILPAITIIILSFVDCTQVIWGVILLTLGVGFEYNNLFILKFKKIKICKESDYIT